jgi:hypothetical protein
MRAIVYVPEVPNLECGPNGQISFRQMEDYFVGISKIISQLKLQAKFIQDECGKELIQDLFAQIFDQTNQYRLLREQIYPST